jgi:hypothetical protein
MNELDVENKPLRDELDSRRTVLADKEKEAADAKAAKDANSAPILDLDAHSYPAVHSFFARDDKWAAGTPGADGFPVDILKFPAGKGDNKFKGWKFDSVAEGVTHVRVNFYYKFLKELETDGNKFGLKLFGEHYGQAAMKECGVDKWCWLSIAAPAVMSDTGHVTLDAADVKNAFEAEIK